LSVDSLQLVAARAARWACVALATAVAICCAEGVANVQAAWAHATISPVVTSADELQQFTLSVPTEKQDASTTSVELDLPHGFAIDSYEPEPGWKRRVQVSPVGNDSVLERVTWSGGSVPTDEDAVFRFNASARQAKTYVFRVQQTYSDGSVVNWAGSESSDTPAPHVKLVANFGSQSSDDNTLALVAVIIAVIALVLALVSLIGADRPLT
jgi:uncharacterized protein YcnI